MKAIWSIIIIALLAVGCRVCPPVSDSTIERDSMRYLSRIESHDSTIFITLKPQIKVVHDTILPNVNGGTTFRPVVAENSYCTATAWIDDGKLYLNLTSKPDSLAYTIRNAFTQWNINQQSSHQSDKVKVVQVKVVPTFYKWCAAVAALFVAIVAFKIAWWWKQKRVL